MKSNLVQTFFTAAAAKCVGCAKHHAEMSKADAAMMDEYEEGTPHHSYHKTRMEKHQMEAAEWTATGEECAACAKSCSATGKAMGLDNSLDELMPMPDGLSVVTSDVPVSIRAVGRAGMRDLPASAENPLYAKIFEGAE
jgi:hypothetical protein